MYQSGDVLAHFKGVSIFLEATTQHAITWCICIKIVKLSVNTWFRVVSWIITSSGASTVRQPKTESNINEGEEENMNADYICV
jgi:hypothetical protein